MNRSNVENWYMMYDEMGTGYRIRPNPDTQDGYNGGAYIGWGDKFVNIQENEFFIPPEIIRDVAEVFALIAKQLSANS